MTITMDKTRKTLLVLSLAIAGATVAGCNNDPGVDDGALDDTTAADTAATTPDPTIDDTMPPAYGDTTGMDGEMITSGPIADQQFYQQASAINRKEIAAGNMAVQQAESQEVKDYAQMIVDEHTALEQEVTDAAGTADAATPAPDPSATAALEGKTGAEFDRAYIDMMVSGHEQAIAMFENAAQNASTEEARQLADDALPELREHLVGARELQEEAGEDVAAMAD